MIIEGIIITGAVYAAWKYDLFGSVSSGLNRLWRFFTSQDLKDANNLLKNENGTQVEAISALKAEIKALQQTNEALVEQLAAVERTTGKGYDAESNDSFVSAVSEVHSDNSAATTPIIPSPPPPPAPPAPNLGVPAKANFGGGDLLAGLTKGSSRLTKAEITEGQEPSSSEKPTVAQLRSVKLKPAKPIARKVEKGLMGELAARMSARRIAMNAHDDESNDPSSQWG